VSLLPDYFFAPDVPLKSASPVSKLVIACDGSSIYGHDTRFLRREIADLVKRIGVDAVVDYSIKPRNLEPPAETCEIRNQGKYDASLSRFWRRGHIIQLALNSDCHL
jgi:hypothetical protein